MKRMLVVMGVALAACGSGSSGAGAKAEDVAAFDAAVQELASVTATYQGASETMTTPVVCAEVLAEYTARMEPVLDRLRIHARDMDGAMRRLGEPGHGDAECVVAEVRTRVEEHARLGCALGLTVARENAARHCAEVRGLADHLRMRGAEAGELEARGYCNRAGWTSEDGETVGWDHQVPACGAGYGPGDCSGTCDPTQDRARDGSGGGTPDRDRDRDGSCGGTCDGPVTADVGATDGLNGGAGAAVDGSVTCDPTQDRAHDGSGGGTPDRDRDRDGSCLDTAVVVAG